jgi:uncharacterized protein (TIGR03084 family)
MLYGVIFRRVWREESSVLLASRRWGVRRPLIKQAFVLAFLWEVCDRLNMALIDELIADLHAESASLDAIVADLPARDWATPTPAAGWTVAHQIGHLCWTDMVATIAVTDPDAFGSVLTDAWSNPLGFVDAEAEAMARCRPAEILREWRRWRPGLTDALAAVPAGAVIAWFGPPMSAASMATARLMETWAHGLDVAEALGVRREPTDRIKSIAHLGVRTRDFAYLVNELEPPAGPFRIELTAPSGELWTWGPVDASNTVRGSAIDFCLLVTQRRAFGDLALAVSGADARTWVSIAQCFAGPPGRGRGVGDGPVRGEER